MVQTLNFSRQGEGLPLVFIHGWGVNAGIWQPTVDLLAKKFEVITFDLPGFSENNHIDLTRYTVAEIAKLVADIIEKPSVIIGWSLGGLVATELALNFSNKVVALVTIASTPFFVENENWSGIKPEVLKSFHQQLLLNPKKTIKSFLRIQAMGSPYVRQDIKLISDLVMAKPMANQEVLDKSLSLLENEDYRQQLPNISQPFLRLYGRLDTLVPKAAIEKIGLLAPKHSELIIFESSSHAPFISQPNEFIEQLSLWLNKFLKY